MRSMGTVEVQGMTQVETTNTEIEWQTQVGTAAALDPLVSFGAEFRELARQRRFVREQDFAMPELPATDAAPTPAPASSPAPRTAATPAPLAAPAPSTTPLDEPLPAPAPRSPEPPVAAAMPSPRLSDDAVGMIGELARMSDRLVETREELAATRVRAAHAEQQVDAANARLMAARVLVQDAQQATRQTAERAAWLEGRCETLQEALELAVNASAWTRFKWRRQMRSGSAV